MEGHGVNVFGRNVSVIIVILLIGLLIIVTVIRQSVNGVVKESSAWLLACQFQQFG